MPEKTQVLTWLSKRARHTVNPYLQRAHMNARVLARQALGTVTTRLTWRPSRYSVGTHFEVCQPHRDLCSRSAVDTCGRHRHQYNTAAGGMASNYTHIIGTGARAARLRALHATCKETSARNHLSPTTRVQVQS